MTPVPPTAGGPKGSDVLRQKRQAIVIPNPPNPNPPNPNPKTCVWVLQPVTPVPPSALSPKARDVQWQKRQAMVLRWEAPVTSLEGFATVTRELARVALKDPSIHLELRDMNYEPWKVRVLFRRSAIQTFTLNPKPKIVVVLPWGEDWENEATSIADRFFIGCEVN